MSGLPSWTPDLNSHTYTKILNTMRRRLTYSAAGNTNTDARFSCDLNSLFVDGFLVDRITGVGKQAVLSGSIPTLLSHIFQQSLVTITRLTGPYCRGGTQIEALSKTLVADCNWQYQRCRPGEGCIEVLQDEYEVPGDFEPGLQDGQRKSGFKTSVFRHMVAINLGRRFMITSDGCVGLVPEETQVNDLVCVLPGCDVPAILRAEGGHYTFIGEWYFISDPFDPIATNRLMREQLCPWNHGRRNNRRLETRDNRHTGI
jgi:hypothetical protein